MSKGKIFVIIIGIVISNGYLTKLVVEIDEYYDIGKSNIRTCF